MVSRLDILMKLAEMQDPLRQGPVERMLSVVPGIGGLAPFVTAAAAPLSRVVQDNPVGKAATGAMLALNAKANPMLMLAPDSSGARMADAALAGFEGNDGNLFQRARAANEAGAGGGRLQALTTGVMNAELDPTNFLGPAGKAMQGTKLARLGALLEATDAAQNMPIEALALAAKKGKNRTLQSALLRRVLGTFEETTGKAGSIPEHLLPLVDGARQFGPEGPARPLDLPLVPSRGEYNLAGRREGMPLLPKAKDEGASALAPDAPNLLELAGRGGVEAAPLGLSGEVNRLADYNAAARRVGLPELGALPKEASPLAPENFSIFRAAKQAKPKRPTQYPNVLDIQPANAVTKAQERAAGELAPLEDVPTELPTPDFPALSGTRESVLGGLSEPELSTLVRLAYPGDTAAGNAIKAHQNPAQLAEAALARLQTSPAAMARLSNADDELARKLAFLPEPGESVGQPGREAFDQLIASRDNGKMGEYLPNAQFFSKRLGIPVEEAQGYIDDLARQGVVGDAMGTLAFKPKPLGGDIAAGGGGGGGLGLLGYPGGINGPIGRAIIPASAGGIAGMAVGAGVGAAADDEDRLGGALKGAGIGGAAGFALGGGASMADLQVPAYLKPVLVHSGQEFRRGMREATEKSTGSVMSAIRNLPATWRISTTHHLRNILGDEGWGRTVLGLLQGKEAHGNLAAIRDDMSTRLAAATPWEREPVQVRDVQRALGREGQLPALGDSLAQAETKILTTTDTMVGGALLSLTNVTNLAGLALGTGIGAIRPGLRAWFEAFNGFQQATFRRAAYVDEAGQGLKLAASRLLPDLQAAGVDVSSLNPEGLFSAKDVEAVAGQQAGDRWAALADAVRENAEGRVKFLFGDYSRRKGVVGAIERMAGGAIPFTSWLIRAYPVGIAMLAQHPAVALGLYHYLQATKPDTEHGQPGYTAGMIPVSTDTPVIGAILEAYMGGVEGTHYIDPIGGISPFGGDVVKPAESDEGQNWYQKATGWLDRTGLPGVNPAIKEVAYATGLDYKEPGNLSRTSGIEQGLGLIPGNPQLPNAVPALRAAVRRGLSPALEGVLPGAEGDKHAQPYDPITRRYAELVFAKTQKPLNDPSNQAYLVGMADPDNDLLQQARREVLLGGAIKNVGSLSSPVGVIGQSAENREYRAGATDIPFSYEQVRRQKDAGYALGGYMQTANDRYTASHPAVSMYKVGNREDAAYELLRQWEKSNADFKFVVGETIYNRARRKKMEELGLIAPAGVK